MKEPLDADYRKGPSIKVKHLILVFLPGWLLTMLGSLFKIQSWEGGGLMLVIGTMIKLFALLLAMIKMFQIKDKRSIFNQ